jgi:predicted nucleic acid-binding protein
MESAINITEQHRLRGADSVIAALADELNIPLKTLDREILARYLQASV